MKLKCTAVPTIFSHRATPKRRKFVNRATATVSEPRSLLMDHSYAPPPGDPPLGVDVPEDVHVDLDAAVSGKSPSKIMDFSWSKLVGLLPILRVWLGLLKVLRYIISVTTTSK